MTNFWLLLLIFQVPSFEILLLEKNLLRHVFRCFSKFSLFEECPLCQTISENRTKMYDYEKVKFVWKISYPPANGASLDIYFRFFEIYKKISLLCQSRNNWGQSLQQTDRRILWHHIRGCLDFFFHMNLLSPYLLSSQGDYTWDPNTTNTSLYYYSIQWVWSTGR